MGVFYWVGFAAELGDGLYLRCHRRIDAALEAGGAYVFGGHCAAVLFAVLDNGSGCFCHHAAATTARALVHSIGSRCRLDALHYRGLAVGDGGGNQI